MQAIERRQLGARGPLGRSPVIARAALMAAALGLGLSGCMGSQPKERLAETVHAMNQATRWGRIPSAAAMVEPAYKPTFLTSHAAWGEGLQLADSHVLQVEMAPGDTVAVALIAYSWYSVSSMTLHTTVVQQQWELRDETYALIGEAVVKGEPSLLPMPTEDAPTADTPGS